MRYFDSPELLSTPPPSRRAAYSNRMAWLMAEMSRLAYIRFEIDKGIGEWAERISRISDVEKAESFLTGELVPGLMNTHGRKALEDALATPGFELVETFNRDGTQAFLATRDRDRIAVLSFRGTEATQWSDIKSDLNALTTNENGARIHSGFLKAFNKVQRPISRAIDHLGDYALYITGHSLGGALALIATRELEQDNVAACYSFGNPRVGSSDFTEYIRTPIYRVVNTADVVPRLPPGIIIELLVDLLRWMNVFIPFMEPIAAWLDDKVSGYRHHGDMRYLTDCRKRDFSDLDLISNITPLARWRRLIKSRLSLNRHVSDHAIEEYCRKLAGYACRIMGIDR